MNCGHPLAARQITVRQWGLITTCWACAVQREIVSKIVGPKTKAKRDAAWQERWT